MKTDIINSLKTLAADRAMLLLVILVVFLSLVYIVIALISLQPTEVQVANRYTVFGETHYYRDKWYYLTAFGMFGLMVAVAHTALIVKLLVNDMRNFAMAFAWLTVGIILVAWVLSRSVLGIAFLS